VQTSAIAHRVADFLEDFPPFQSMEKADLILLASRGRVKFHQVDEFLLWQAAAHGPHVFVIQKGTVSLWQGSEAEEELRDMRGPGDLLGIDRFHGAPSVVYSAKAAGDVVVYALEAETFEQLLAKYPQAQRYIAAQSSVASAYLAPDHRKGLHETLLYDVVRRVDPPVCAAGNTIRQAARRMHAASEDALAVVDGEGHIAGIVTAASILAAVAAPGFDANKSVESLMDAAPMIVAPEVTVSDCALAVGATGVAAVTQGGSAQGRLHGLITTADLDPAFGDHPSAILLAVPRAASIESLRHLQQRARAFVLERLAAPSAVEWLAEFLHRTDVAILQRLAVLQPPPSQGFCWCYYGAAGRAELLSPLCARSMLLIEDASSQEALTAWYGKMRGALHECGYLARDARFDSASSCAPLADWQQRYAGWIQDPLSNPIHQARPLFDLRAVMGNRQLWRTLEASVKEDLRSNPVFVRLLANDCLSSLPPLTFFRDAVVDEEGVSSGIFDLEKTALRPLVDVGRVFGIAAGRALGGTTQERFRLARTLLPEREAIFRQASDTMRIVLYQQARAGIRQQSSGSELQPSMLSHYDRQILKSGFRSILQLLEFTADGAWLEAA
jgi:CBS domain-containing protein